MHGDDMDNKINDISPEMREFYKWLRGRPGMWTGSNEIHDLNVFMQGMTTGAKFFLKEEEPVIIPEGFTGYVEKLQFRGTPGKGQQECHSKVV